MRSEMLLKKITIELSEIQQQVRNQFDKLTFEQLNWKENPESWSIAECLEHLNIYAGYYLPTIEKQLGKTSKSKGNIDEEAKSTWFGRFSIKSIHPDNVKKQKTMKHLNPSNSKVEGDVVKRFIDFQIKFQSLLDESRMVNLNKVKIPVEFFKLLKINLGDCFQFLIAHEQRHLNQAIKVKEKVMALGKVNAS